MKKSEVKNLVTTLPLIIFLELQVVYYNPPVSLIFFYLYDLHPVVGLPVFLLLHAPQHLLFTSRLNSNETGSRDFLVNIGMEQPAAADFGMESANQSR
jgi:hypothetical protein